MTTATMERPVETENKPKRAYNRTKPANNELQKTIAAKLLVILEQKLGNIGLGEAKFFTMIGASPTTGCAMRKGYLCKAENLIVICLALGIDMNQFFGALIPGTSNFVAVYEKKMDEIRKHEALADRLRTEMNALVKGRRPAISGE